MHNSPKFGIGTDIENIDRFKKLDVVKNCAFLNRIFTKNELSYCFTSEDASSHLAVRYAGKEAIVKALTSIGRTCFQYKDLEILNDEKGVPMAKINKPGFRDLQIYLSLSHCGDKAIAFAMVIASNNRKFQR